MDGRARTTLAGMTSSRRPHAAATFALAVLTLSAGCGLLPAQPVDASAAQTRYAGLPGALRDQLEAELGALPAEDAEAIAYSGSAEDCSWSPGGVTVPDDQGDTLLDDVADAAQPVLTDHGFGELRPAEKDGVEPYLVATGEHGAEVTVTRFGDVHIAIEISVDTGGEACDPATLP